MMRTQAHGPRAFTLIEVIVALTISAVLLSVVLGILSASLKDGRRARAHSAMLRDADIVTHLLNSELRLAGLGVPAASGTHVDPNFGTAGPMSFYGSVLVARETAVGVLGDLPRPDANLSAFGALHTRPTGDSNAVAWHNENNGACMPDLGAGSCIAGRESLFFPDDAAGCTATGTGAPFTDRKCPWGMRRTASGDYVVIVAGDRTWATGMLNGNVRQVPIAGLATVTSAELNPGFLFDVPDPVDGTPKPIWPNNTAVARPGGVAGQGFVATLDRVFFQLVGTTIVRKHCWGAPNPNHAAWPNALTNAVPASPHLVSAAAVAPSTPALPNNECTDNEVVARNVSPLPGNTVALRFRYYDNLGAQITIANPVAAPPAKADVARIDYTIDFSQTVDGRPLTHQVSGSVRLTNLLP